MACPLLGTQVWGTVQLHILVKPRAIQLVLSTRAAFPSSADTLQGTSAPSRECSGAWGLEAALERRDSSTEGKGVTGRAAGGACSHGVSRSKGFLSSMPNGSHNSATRNCQIAEN